MPGARRTRTIEVRGRVALAICLLAAAIPMLLNAFGVTQYESERPFGDPYRPTDRSLADRICLASEWMVPASLLVWVGSWFRVRYPNSFTQAGGRFWQFAIGGCGLLLSLAYCVYWSLQPYTGEHFGLVQGWPLGAGGLLLVWSYVAWHR